MRYTALFIIGSLFFSSISSADEPLLKRRNVNPSLNCENGPSQINNQSEFSLIFGDYTEEDGTLKILSRKPLRVHVYAEVFEGEKSSVTEHLVKKSLISNLYRVFSFSNVDKVTVTSSAKETNISNGSKFYKILKSPTYTITKTREQALADLRKYTDAKDFGDLFEKHQVCMFSPVAKRFLYDDQGGIGITKFFGDIKNGGK